jgi:Ca2+-binding RTX toxin-like protein
VFVGDGQPDTVVLHGTAGNDEADVDAVGGTALVQSLPATVEVTGGEPGLDTLTLDLRGGNDLLDATGSRLGALELVLAAGDGDDLLFAGAAGDVLAGGAGDDVLRGGDGADVFACGPDDDIVLNVGPGDVLVGDC